MGTEQNKYLTLLGASVQRLPVDSFENQNVNVTECVN